MTVTATAEEGYTFAGWYDGETCVCETEKYTFTLKADTGLTAKFDKEPEPPAVQYKVSVTVTGDGTAAASLESAEEGTKDHDHGGAGKRQPA